MPSNTAPLPHSDPSRAPEAPHTSEAWTALESIAQAAMPSFLMKQRWYPAKDVGTPAVRPVTLLPLEAEGVSAAAAIWEVEPPGRSPFRMFVPVAVVSASAADPAYLITELPRQSGADPTRALVDAVSQDPFIRAWVKLHLEAEHESASKPLRVGSTKQLSDSGLDASSDWRIRRGKAEQSNTSIRVGERAILKLIRKLEEGIHPELEVGRYLTEEGFTAVPAMLGWIQTAQNPAESTTLSLLQSFVPNQGDGWSWIEERLTQAAREDTEEPIADSLRWLEVLARQTAAMHRVFAAGRGGPAFIPEPVQVRDLQEWAHAGLAMASRAFQAIAEEGHFPDQETAELAAALRAERSLVEHSFESIGHLTADFAKTRHHGDFHLGQTLVCGSEAMIIDFEGEPMRPIAQRRAKHCVLRDVAGMLRSLSYAAAAAARSLSEDLSGERLQRAQARLASWQDNATTLFVRTYSSATKGLSSLPSTEEHTQKLLRFFLLEKVLYELVYEETNRPDWIGIPLRGVLNLLRAAGS